MGKTLDFFGEKKESTKEIAKKSVEIVKVGLALGIAGVGLGHGVSAIRGGS
jgi:mannose/fructose/N-acetylgalactosamine-specific phosphotransferase system component IID|tara:strand:+ start:2100 stop:2252 length:153 start_codon:yes stop_codon:yes gene_type:complete